MGSVLGGLDEDGDALGEVVREALGESVEGSVALVLPVPSGLGEPAALAVANAEEMGEAEGTEVAVD